MKQKLLTDIELDVHELKCLMDSYSKEPTYTLSELLKRSIQRMQDRLELLTQELDSVQDSLVIEEAALEQTVLEETALGETVLEDANVGDTNLEENVLKHAVVEKATSEAVITREAEPVVPEEPVTPEQSVVPEEEPVTPEEGDIVKEPEYKPSVLGESLKMSAGLRHSISLNDSFRFSRELFGGDTELMNRVIEQISVMSSYKTAIAFLSSKVNINQENEALNDLLELLKKYFNQSV